MDRRALAELFRQMEEGWDIPTPTSAMRVAAPKANVRPEGLPYSAAENLWHAVYWQRVWLGQLEGRKPASMMEVWKGDWQSPAPREWPALRSEFVDGLRRARTIAESEPFAHGCPSDEEAVSVLLRIAIHAAYHIGQLNLLRRAAASRATSS